MAKKCSECGQPLDFLDLFYNSCTDCAQKRVYGSQVSINLKPSKTINLKPSKTTDAKAQVAPAREYTSGWVEGLLTITWILCFGGAAVLGFMALAAANVPYEQGTAIVLTAYAVSLAVSGVIFAAIGKIISSLTSINGNLRLLVTQNEVRVVHREEGAESATDIVS